jgi:fumarylacetoacetase
MSVPSKEGNATFEPCQKLDYDGEFAAFVGHGHEMGSAIDVNKAEDHISGMLLINDWSASDIQWREAAPLGPFNDKNFATRVSPWIVFVDALEPYRTAPLGKVSPWPVLMALEW